MITLLQLITTDKPLSKYYQLLQDELTDFLANIVIDITDNGQTHNTTPEIRWIIMKDDYEKYSNIISHMVSQLLANLDASKVN